MADQQAGAMRERGAWPTERGHHHDGQGLLQKLQEHSPHSKHVLGFLTLAASAVALLVVGGFALAGLAITLVVAAPLLLLASPILIPLGFFLFLMVSGFVAFVAFVAVSLSVASWVYRYLKGGQPLGSHQIDAAKRSLADTVHRAKERAQNYAGYVKVRSQEAAPGA